jgi:hypothetical protein
VGDYDRTTKSDGALTRVIEEKIVHPLYSPKERKWDMMVMRLDRPVSKQYVRLNSDPSFPRESAEVSVMGFGLTTYETGPDGTMTGVLAEILQEATVNYIDNEICDFMHSFEEVTSDMLCAAADGRDACLGMLEIVACAHGLPRTVPFSLSKFVLCR